MNSKFKLEKPYRNILHNWLLDKKIPYSCYKTASYLLDVYYAPSNKGKKHKDIVIRPSVKAIMVNTGYSEWAICSALAWLENDGRKNLYKRKATTRKLPQLIIRRLPGVNDPHKTTFTDLNPLFNMFYNEWSIILKNKPSSKGIPKPRKPKRTENQVRFRYPLSRSRHELGLTPKEVEITLMLIDKAIKTHNFTVIVNHLEIAEGSASHPNTVKKCMTKLEEKGLAIKSRNGNDTNTYDLIPLRNKLVKIDKKLRANRYVLQNPDYAKTRFTALDIQSCINNVILKEEESIIRELILNKRTFIYFLNTFQTLEIGAQENPGEELWFVDKVYPQSGNLENQLANFFGLRHDLRHSLVFSQNKRGNYKVNEFTISSNLSPSVPKTMTYRKAPIYGDPANYGYEGKRLNQMYPDINLFLPRICSDLDSEQNNTRVTNRLAKENGKEKFNYTGDEWLKDIEVKTKNPFKFCNWMINKTLDIASELKTQLDTSREYLNKQMDMLMRDKIDRLIYIFGEDAGKKAIEQGIDFFKYTGWTPEGFRSLCGEMLTHTSKIPPQTSPVAPGSTQSIEVGSLC